MHLKQLKTCIAVAESGSLSKAADRLKLGQPALSRHIRMLEEEIGAQLFVRHKRGMEPTSLGSELVASVKGLVSQLEKSVESAVGASGQPSGQVTLGIIPTLIGILATRIFQRLAHDSPKISLRVVEGFPSHLVELMQNGSIDAAILAGPGSDLHLRTTDLLFEEYVLVGNNTCDLDPAEPVPGDVLASVPLILPGKSERHRNALEVVAARENFALNVVYEVESFPLILSLLEDGLGYTVVPLSAVARQVDSGTLRFAPFVGGSIRRSIVLALPTSRPDPRATQLVTQVVVEEIARLIAEGRWQAQPDGPVRRAWERLTA